jgi:hypothetical protein
MTTDVLTRFPDELFENTDQAKVKQLIQEANYEATNRFFEQFNPQKSDATSIKNATETMGLVLTDRVTSDTWLEALCGQDVAGNQFGALRLHLKNVLMAPTVPSPAHLQAMPQTKVLCISAVLGVLLGTVLSNLVGGISEGFNLFSLILGSYVFDTAGAALGVYAVIQFVNSEWLRKWSLPVIGSIATIDTALQVTIAGRFLPFLSLNNYLLRMLLYVIAAVIAYVSHHTIKRDFPDYRREVELINEQWLHHAKTITLVLLRKLKESDEVSSTPQNKDTSVLRKITRIVQKLQQSQPDDLRIGLTEIEQELATAGFVVQSTDEQLYQELDWDETLHEQYTVMGIPHQGRRVRVITLPIVRDGKLEKKGELLLLK